MRKLKRLSDVSPDFIPMPKIPNFVPGPRIHPATGLRWCLYGLRRNGRIIKLATTLIGGRRYTTPSDIERFLSECNGRECNGETTEPVPEADLTRRALAAGELLDSRGVRSPAPQADPSSLPSRSPPP